MAQALIQIVIPFAAMFAIMYFLLILPEKKRTKKYNEMVICDKKSLDFPSQVLLSGRVLFPIYLYYIVRFFYGFSSVFLKIQKIFFSHISKERCLLAFQA